MENTTVSGRVDKDLLEKLELLAKATARSRSFLVAEAVRAYVEEQLWQIEAIKEGIRQADQNKFASDRELRQSLAKWRANAD
jgi:RHH-type rel operon transcriptional repressor/antitoxin RelB